MKKVKQLAALLLTLCMLIGMPFAVSAEDVSEEFKIVSVEEAPDDSSKLKALGVSDETITAYKGRMVIVTFNSKPSDAMITAIDNNTLKGRIVMTGSINRAQDGNKTDDVTANELGRCGENAILFGYGNGSFKKTGATTASVFYKHFDILRSSVSTKDDVHSGLAMGLTSCQFYFQKNGAGDLSKLTNEAGVVLSNPTTKVTITQHPFRITGVAPMPTAMVEKIGAPADYTWLVEFNDAVDKNSIVNNNRFRLRAYTINGTQADNLTLNFESELSAKLSQNQLAFTTAANRTMAYFNSKIESMDTGCYGVGSFVVTAIQLIEDNDNIVDGLSSIHGKTLGYSTLTYDSKYESINSDKFSSAAIGETLYASFAEALKKATSGDTITLMGYSDMTSDAVLIIPAGVTVDLNGFSIKANNLMSFGNLIDGRDGITGGVIVSNDMTKAFAVLQQNNTALPLYDTEDACYRFYNYTLKSAGPRDATANSVAFGAQLIFTNTNAYSLLAKDTGIEIEMALAATKNEKTTNIPYVFTSSTLEKYQETWMNPNRDTSKTPTLVLTVSGIAGISEISCAPSVCSTSTFVRDTADAVTYPVVE